MDLLGSILGSMEKPPSAADGEKKKARGEPNDTESVVRMLKKIPGIKLTVWLITASDCIGQVPDGEMFMLSVRRQEI